MNDSFLEDLELTTKPQASHPANRHVTTRTRTSSPLQHISENPVENLMQRRTLPSVPETKQTSSKELVAKHRRIPSEPDAGKQIARIKAPEKREGPETKLRTVENKLKPVENKFKTDRNDARNKVQEARARVAEKKVIGKDNTIRSGGYKENSYSSDVSSKENSRPSDSSKESNSQMDKSKEKGKKCNCSSKDAKEKESVAFLAAIKDLVSTYTKQESAKVLRAMQELHINSQANLIKNIMFQTDELVKEMHPSKESARMRVLFDQNTNLQEYIKSLEARIEGMQKKLQDYELLKQENITLQLKCKELSKQ